MKMKMEGTNRVLNKYVNFGEGCYEEEVKMKMEAMETL